MKKSTIWILGIVMGLSFLSLLYLQVSYIEEMMKTRKEQFDSAVRNSLDQVSKDVEYAETMRWLVEDISDAERKALTENNTSLGQNNVVRGTQRFQVKSRDGKIISDFELRVMKIKPSELPKAMVRGRNTIPQTSNSMLEAIKNRYMYQRALLDEVVLDMIRRASDKSIGDRVRFRDLDDYLKSNLYNNGIDLPYHFAVIDKDGREVYRCADYEAKGSEESYQQALFKNDPPAKMSILKVHFPGKKDYIFDSIKESEQMILTDPALGTIEKLQRILGVLPEGYQNIDLRKLYSLRDKYPKIYHKVELRLETGWEPTIQLIETGMAEGSIRPVPICLVKMMLEASIEQFFQRDILAQNHLTYVDALNEVVTILMYGITQRQ